MSPQTQGTSRRVSAAPGSMMTTTGMVAGIEASDSSGEENDGAMVAGIELLEEVASAKCAPRARSGSGVQRPWREVQRPWREV